MLVYIKAFMVHWHTNAENASRGGNNGQSGRSHELSGKMFIFIIIMGFVFNFCI